MADILVGVTSRVLNPVHPVNPVKVQFMFSELNLRDALNELINGLKR